LVNLLSKGSITVCKRRGDAMNPAIFGGVPDEGALYRNGAPGGF
jgi:hypothetical protein